MATHDSIGDFLTIIRNASKAGKESCKAQYSKLREGIAAILKDEGYIASYEVTGEKAEKAINIVLKYVGGVPALTNISRARISNTAKSPESSTAWEFPSSPPPRAFSKTPNAAPRRSAGKSSAKSGKEAS